jgi:hypothetical protein
MPPRHCCCNVRCIIDSDDFNRSDATTLGAKWIQDDWHIDALRAKSTAASNAIFTTVHPFTSMEVVVRTKNEVADNGDVYRVMINVVDEDNYHFCDFARNGVNTSTLTLGVCSGGGETVLATDTIAGLLETERDVAVLIAPNEFCASVTNATFSKVYADEDPDAGGFRGGMGANKAGLFFDDFRLNKHFDNDPSCALCLCPCQGEYIPPVLCLHIVGTGRLATMDCEVELAWDRISQYWKAEFMCCGQFWSVWFFCPELPDYDPLTSKLIIDIGCNSSDGIGGGDRLPFYASCNPLLWEFGPYTVTPGDLACGSGPCGPDLINGGTYSITITECA